MNTRQYPRTSTQAFPKTTQYACAVERSRRSRDAFEPFRWALALVGIYMMVTAPHWWRLLFGA
jgi:hypothetical protein